MSEETSVKSGLKFDGTIHLGHLLVFIGMVGSVVSLYATFVAQNERTNYRLDSIEKVISDQSAYNKAILDILGKLQVGQAVTTDRLDRLDRQERNKSRNGLPVNPYPQSNHL